jgi:iron complex outermembrane receptor protein
MPRLFLFACASTLALAVQPAMAAQDASPKELSEVVVTAAPYVVSLGSTTTSVDVVKREELDRAPPAGLGEVLSHVPGVRSSFFGPGASRPVIRGLTGPRVLVLTNGIGLIDASGLSPDHQVASDPQEAERIEVLRGPSALAYGGSAIGGVVNVIDDRIPSAFEAGVHGRGLYSYSTVDDGSQIGGAVAAGAGGRWMLTADGLHRHTGDYEIPVAPGVVGNTFVRLDAYGMGASYVGDGAWGGLAVKRTETEYGSAAEESVSIGLKQTRVDARGAADVDWGVFDRLKFAAGYADYTHTEFEDDEPGTTFLSQGYEARVELVQRDRNGWQGALGLQALHRDFDAIGEEALIPKTRIGEVGAFALQRLDKDRWGVEGGLRLDARKLDSLRGARDFTNLSASAAAFVRPLPGWFVGLSVSRTSRAPTEEELFSLGPHPATGQFEIGDADLGKEVSWSTEASLHYGAGPVTVDAHAYYVKYENFIDLVPTGAEDAESGFPVFRFVESGATFRGYELEGSWRFWEGAGRSLTVEGASDYVRGTTDFGPAVRIPPWSATGRLVYKTDPLSARLEVRRVAGQDRVAPFETPTGGYTLLNASLTVRPLASDRDLKVFLEANNLTDALAREHASVLKDVAPLPGRSFRVGVGYRF